MRLLIKLCVIFLPIAAAVLFYKPGFLESKLPIPADTIVGMYHPWRDFFGNLPFKNFILTDPVRQQYPWRELSIALIKDFQLPLWNPYNFAGTPLLANIQSAIFYPLNILFLVISFPIAWSIYIMLAPVLGILFMFLFLRNLNLNRSSAIFGSICSVLSGFFVAWLENGVLTHTLLWLPAILWSMDKIGQTNKKRFFILYPLFLVISFFAGHWQTFFYLFLFSQAYMLIKYPRFLPKFLILDCFFALISLPQLLPSLSFINLSARGNDQVWINNAGWFIPWQNLIQFISPDFFGNPSTLNYTGQFSYQEFVGYIGIPGLIFAFCSLFVRRKIIWFFAGAVIVSLLFATATPIAKLPFILNIPLISSSMPTRLLSIIDFSLAVLAAFGINYFFTLKNQGKYVFGLFFLLLGTLWLISPSKYLIIPSGMLIATLIFRKYLMVLVVLVVLDLGFFAYKFLPFTSSKYLYPQTKISTFLQENTKEDHSRFMTLNDEIFPPNFNIIYRLQTISGYDPLYLKTYGNLVGGGNRIIVPKDYKNSLIDILGVKYILTFDDISSTDYVLVMQEGKTKVFENKKVLPRVIMDNGLARITSYSENKVIIKTSSTTQSLLTLTDMDYPGWKVFIDNYPSTIIPTKDNFRSVEVGAGEHEVIFKMEYELW